MENTKSDVSLAQYSGEDRVLRATELRALHANKKNLGYFRTGFDELDSKRMTDGGVREGELVVVSGKTKNGKTLFCQSLTAQFSRQGLVTHWFTYEVPMYQFLDQMDQSTDFCAPAMLNDTRFEWIGEKIIEGILKHKAKVIFIDHLHYLLDLGRVKNPTLEIGKMVRDLKRLAMALEVSIFVISHVRNIEPGKEATADDLRDSGLIKCEADSTWMVTRMMDSGVASNHAKLTICNHRRTGAMGESMGMVKVGRYFEQADYYAKPEPAKEPPAERSWTEPRETQEILAGVGD